MVSGQRVPLTGARLLPSVIAWIHDEMVRERLRVPISETSGAPIPWWRQHHFTHQEVEQRDQQREDKEGQCRPSQPTRRESVDHATQQSEWDTEQHRQYEAPIPSEPGTTGGSNEQERPPM